MVLVFLRWQYHPGPHAGVAATPALAVNRTRGRCRTFPTQKGRSVLANFFLYLCLAFAAATPVIAIKSSLATQQAVRIRLRILTAATASGLVISLLTAVSLAGLLTV